MQPVNKKTKKATVAKAKGTGKPLKTKPNEMDLDEDELDSEIDTDEETTSKKGKSSTDQYQKVCRLYQGVFCLGANPTQF